MIRVAETIAKGMEFARIDLYSDGKRNIKFGEITFTPGDALSRFTRACLEGEGATGGQSRIADLEFDKWLGSLFGKTQSTSLAREGGTPPGQSLSHVAGHDGALASTTML